MEGEKILKLRYGSVTPALIDLLREIQREKKLEDFLLGDGTGLSLQIGHRKSDEIELFINGEFNSFAIISFLGRNFETQYQLVQNDEEMLQAVIQGIKVSFIKTGEANIGEPIVCDSLKLLHKKDIAAMKLMEICRRKEAKDYIDIWYLLHEYPLEDLFAFFRTKYDRDDTEEIKKALCEGGQANPYGWIKIKMLKNDIFLSEIPKDLAGIVADYEKKKSPAGKKWSLFGKNN
jgi:hypothetical protein